MGQPTIVGYRRVLRIEMEIVDKCCREACARVFHAVVVIFFRRELSAARGACNSSYLGDR